MKYEGKFGLGEIVYIKGAVDARIRRPADDEVAMVMAAHFQLGQNPIYTVRYRDGAGHQRTETMPAEMLVGDPEYDQERGCYPEESK